LKKTFLTLTEVSKVGSEIWGRVGIEGMAKTEVVEEEADGLEGLGADVKAKAYMLYLS